MIFLVLAALTWGSSFPVITYTLRDVSPMLFVVLRFAVAFTMLTLRYPRLLRRVLRRDLFLISIPNALSFILQFKGQELTTASKMALFVNSSPVFVVVLGAFLFRDELKRTQLLATAIALIGVVITSTGLNFSDLAALNVGDILGVLVGLSWAAFIVFSRNIVKRHGPYLLAQGLYFWTIVMTVPFLLIEPARFAWAATPGILYLSVVATLVGYYLYLRGVQSVTPLATSVIILIEVVVAFVISYFFLGESFSPLETVGVALVMGGVALVLRR
jgi:drug/metabolite transporter (DMT)-like permease